MHFACTSLSELCKQLTLSVTSDNLKIDLSILSNRIDYIIFSVQCWSSMLIQFSHTELGDVVSHIT